MPDSTLKAPSTVTSPSRGILFTRAEIEAQAAAAEQAATSPDSSESARQELRDRASMLRERLTEGDFRVGDRLVIDIQADVTVLDTFVVRSGRVLTLPGIPEVSLRGVIRSEVNEYLSAQYARYVKVSAVKVTTLVRLAMLGSIGKPGFYTLASDVLVSDAIMIAGGPASDAAMDKIVARRGKDEVVKAKRMRAALQDGITLDQLDMRSGDELFVGKRKARTLESSMRNVSLAIGLGATIFGLFAISRRR